MLQARKTINFKNSKRVNVDLRSGEKNKLNCSDIVFMLMTKNLNSLSDIVYNFTRETDVLNSLATNTNESERRGVSMRAYLAKENAVELHNEIQDKRKFLNKYKKIGQTALLSFENIQQIRFMESRAYELDLIMSEVRADIDIAIERYGHIIDYDNTRNSTQLNHIMALFTVITVSCLPASIMSGIGGMNIKFPFMISDDSKSYVPFFVYLGFMLILFFVLFLWFSKFLKK
jgi:Mg2+ and Co2+ transporter CorA